MISTTQQTWLTEGMSASLATWQLLGNQDIMARMWFPATVLQAQATGNLSAVTTAITDYLNAKGARVGAALGGPALTPTQTGLLNTTSNPLLPYNLDSWDGYPSNREAVLQTVKAQGKKLVALSGDSHNAWFAHLTTLAGEKVGVEFAASSVTAPGFESVGLGELAGALDGSTVVSTLPPGAATIENGLGLVNDLRYTNSKQRGYLAMTVTADAVKGEYVFMDTVKSTTYQAVVGKTITVKATTNPTTGVVTYDSTYA
jgi:alkaline phosphatase D